MKSDVSHVARVDMEASIRDWLCAYIAQLIEVPRVAIEVNVEFDEYGIDSTAAAGLSGDLSDWLGIHIEADITQDHRTIEQLTEELCDRVTVQESS